MDFEETRWNPHSEGHDAQVYYDPGENAVGFRGLRGRFFLAATVMVHPRQKGGLIEVVAFRNAVDNLDSFPRMPAVLASWNRALYAIYGGDPHDVEVVDIPTSGLWDLRP